MSIWQTKEWQLMLEKSWQVTNTYKVDWVFIEKRGIWLWYYALFVIWLDEELKTDKLEKELIELCKDENTLFIQIETLDYDDFSKTISKWWTLFENWHYKKFLIHHAALIDLTKSKEDILAWMKQKWRYNIKLAKKKWIKAEIVEKNDKNIESFYDLLIETTIRDGFSWNSINYYKNLLKDIKDSELILAYKDEEIIAWWIFIFWKDVSIYYYWASSGLTEYRNLMAPYLVQWIAIKEAKKRWSKLYDFWWVSGPNKLNSSLKWVTEFKLKFTNNIKRISNSFIWIRSRRQYKLVNFIRKKLKKKK